ncbi:MAG: hypothetical protein JWO91_2809 [Acidobacteriaceae bacterium]|nr:hypothetical protein [Acidobacteriaceae bacterium]
MKDRTKKPAAYHFPAVPLTAVSANRKGKHRKIVSNILSDLERLDEFSALRINLAEAGVKKADLRSAIHRAAKSRRIPLLTTSDEAHLYVFHRPAANKMGR